MDKIVLWLSMVYVDCACWLESIQLIYLVKWCASNLNMCPVELFISEQINSMKLWERYKNHFDTPILRVRSLHLNWFDIINAKWRVRQREKQNKNRKIDEYRLNSANKKVKKKNPPIYIRKRERDSLHSSRESNVMYASISCAVLINITTKFIYDLNIHIEMALYCHYGDYIMILASDFSTVQPFQPTSSFIRHQHKYIHYNEYLFEFKNARSACGNLFPHIKQITFSMCSTPIPLIHLFDSRSTKLESIRAFVLRVCRYVYSHTKIQCNIFVWLLTNVFFPKPIYVLINRIFSNVHWFRRCQQIYSASSSVSVHPPIHMVSIMCVSNVPFFRERSFFCSLELMFFTSFFSWLSFHRFVEDYSRENNRISF